jgi:gliding motility-associated-like protein
LNGCVYNTNVIVTQPAILTLNANIISNYFGQAVSCVGATDGIVDGDVTGGTPGYQYSWNGGPFTALNPINNLGVGTTTLQVMDANGCAAEDQVDLEANPLPTFDLPPVIYSCEGYEVSINSNTEPSSSCTWVFSDGQTINDCGPVYVSFPEQEMCYDMQLTVINEQGCINSTSITDFICVVPNPVASFSPSEYEVSFTNPGLNFNNSSINAENYFWDFGDNSPLSQDENPYHEYSVDENTSQYDVWLYAVSLYGCIDSTLRVITVKEDLIIYVPNTFTPDGDQFNNEFRPVITSGFSDDGYSLFIFNRWGQLVFESNDQSIGWDGSYNGQNCQDGTYTWKIILKNIENDNKEEYVGHVNLLR